MSKTPSIKLNYEEVLEFCEKYNSIEQFINIFCKNDERPNIFFEFSPGLANQKLVFEKEMDRIKKEKLLTFSASKKTNIGISNTRNNLESQSEFSSKKKQRPELIKNFEQEFSSSEAELEKDVKNFMKTQKIEKKQSEKKPQKNLKKSTSSSSSCESDKGKDKKEKAPNLKKNNEENQKKSSSSEDIEILMDVYEESDSEIEDKMIQNRSILHESIISKANSHQRSTILFEGLNEEIMFVLKKHKKIRERIENIFQSYGFDYEILEDKIRLLFDSSNKNKIDLVKSRLSPILNIKSLTFNLLAVKYHGLKKVFINRRLEKVWLEVFDYKKSEKSKKNPELIVKLFYFEKKPEDEKQSGLLEKIRKLFKDYECKKINLLNFYRRWKFGEDKEFMTLLNKESSMIQQIFESKLKDNLEREIENLKWNKNNYVKLLIFKNKENKYFDSSLIYYWLGSNFQKESKSYFKEVDKLFRDRIFIRIHYSSENLEKYLKKIDKEDLYNIYQILLDFNENEIFLLGLKDSMMKFLLELDQKYPKVNKYLNKSNTLKITINKNKFCLDNQLNEEYHPKIVNFFKENKIDCEIFRTQPGNLNTLYTEITYKDIISNQEKLKILFSMIDRSKDWIPVTVAEEKNLSSNSKRTEKKQENEMFILENEDDDELNF